MASVGGPQRNTCKAPPLRLTSDERKAMLAELTSLEDVRVRAVAPLSASPRSRGSLQQEAATDAKLWSQLFDAGQMPPKAAHKIIAVVPRLDFSCLHGGVAPRRGEARQPTAAEQQAVAQVAAPAEASPEALNTHPQAKPVAAAIACLGPLAMLPPKQPAMRREFIFV